MHEIFGRNYYIDVDAIIEVCRPSYSPHKEPEIEETLTETGDQPSPDEPSGGGELNIFKFEIYKACVERVLGEYNEVDDNLGAFVEKQLSPSFNLAFNTLLKYQIIKEDNDE